jgi:hypothetical protein
MLNLWPLRADPWRVRPVATTKYDAVSLSFFGRRLLDGNDVDGADVGIGGEQVRGDLAEG